MDSIQQIAIADFSLDAFPASSKTRVHLIVEWLADGTPLYFPTLIVRGAKDGPTLLVNASTHGDEFEGIFATQDVFEQLLPEEMSGTFIGIPVLNQLAFANGTRESNVDYLNLARTFPGSATGTPTQRIAHAFTTYMLPIADFYIDLHSGGNNYALYPLSGYQVLEPEITKKQYEACVAFGVELVWASAKLPGRTLSAAGDLNVPAIYVELRGEGRCLPEMRQKAVWGVHNVLAYLGICQGDYPREPIQYAESLEQGGGHLQADHPSPCGGLFDPDVNLWQPVRAGERLGVVRHPDGRVLAEIPVSRSGRVLFLRTFSRVSPGDCLAYVLALPDAASAEE
jgi:predicted deacylase